jgi:hypothetical protein
MQQKCYHVSQIRNFLISERKIICNRSDQIQNFKINLNFVFKLLKRRLIIKQKNKIQNMLFCVKKTLASDKKIKCERGLVVFRETGVNCAIFFDEVKDLPKFPHVLFPFRFPPLSILRRHSLSWNFTLIDTNRGHLMYPLKSFDKSFGNLKNEINKTSGTS